MVQELGQPFHADLQPVLAPLTTPFDEFNVELPRKIMNLSELLTRTVNGTGHTTPSEFCTTSM